MDSEHAEKFSVFVGNLDTSMSETDLQYLFEKY
jgi:RNA recognition motif-containing protein